MQWAAPATLALYRIMREHHVVHECLEVTCVLIDGLQVHYTPVLCPFAPLGRLTTEPLSPEIKGVDGVSLLHEMSQKVSVLDKGLSKTSTKQHGVTFPLLVQHAYL